MSSGITKPQNELHEDEKVNDLKEKNIQHSEILVNRDLMGDAFEGENREHELGLWEAFKSHPMACFWAFTMCFTIVSPSTRWGSAPHSQCARL